MVVNSCSHAHDCRTKLPAPQRTPRSTRRWPRSTRTRAARPRSASSGAARNSPPPSPAKSGPSRATATSTRACAPRGRPPRAAARRPARWRRRRGSCGRWRSWAFSSTTRLRQTRRLRAFLGTMRRCAPTCGARRTMRCSCGARWAAPAQFRSRCATSALLPRSNLRAHGQTIVRCVNPSRSVLRSTLRRWHAWLCTLSAFGTTCGGFPLACGVT